MSDFDPDYWGAAIRHLAQTRAESPAPPAEDEMTDTSREAVEKVLREVEVLPAEFAEDLAVLEDAAATLRALLARVEAAEALAEAVRAYSAAPVTQIGAYADRVAAALAAWDAAKAKGPAVSREALPSDS